MSGARGLTTLEVLVATAGTLLVLASLGQAASLQRRLFEREARHLELRESARRVLDLVAREIRGAGFAPVAAGPFDGLSEGIAAAAADRIELRADRHGASGGDPPDGAVALDSDERVSFHRSAAGRSLYETVGSQVLPLTFEVEVPAGGFRLRYLDACGGEILPGEGGGVADADRRRIRRIAIALRVADPGGSPAVTEATTATLRNRSELRCAP